MSDVGPKAVIIIYVSRAKWPLKRADIMVYVAR